MWCLQRGFYVPPSEVDIADRRRYWTPSRRVIARRDGNLWLPERSQRGSRTASISSLRAACEATVRRIRLGSASPPPAGTVLCYECLRRRQHGYNTTGLASGSTTFTSACTPAEPLLPQLLAERCPVNFTLMSSESPRHLMRYSSRLPTLLYNEGVDRVLGCGGELQVVEFRRPAPHLPYRPDRLALTIRGRI